MSTLPRGEGERVEGRAGASPRAWGEHLRFAWDHQLMNPKANPALYDAIGSTYSVTRAEDPRLAAAIRQALGDATSVVNVGAGTGNYEPADMAVIAVEPSQQMIDQRPPNRVSALLGTAERLPLKDNAADAALAVLSDHHWNDRHAGLCELRRVARRRVVLVNADPELADLFWLTKDYLPSFHGLVPQRFETPGAWRASLEAALGRVTVRPLPVPHDCRDGFYQAWWRRPNAYLSTDVRANTSVFHQLDPADVQHALERLEADLASGAWGRRNTHLLGRSEFDVGLRIAVAEVGDAA
jgi:SAM-dependent methyltransferase